MNKQLKTCSRCKYLLGFARDDIKTLKNAIKYLQDSNLRQLNVDLESLINEQPNP